MKIFQGGATGAIGKRLVPLLLQAGYQVVGTTRSTSRAQELRAAGVEPVVVDVFDRGSVIRVVVAAHPDVVMHQLTDLPSGLAPNSPSIRPSATSASLVWKPWLAAARIRRCAPRESRRQAT